MTETHDVIVIGAGCAGLNISQKLGQFGLNVCLVDLKSDLLNVSFHTLGSFIDLREAELSDNIVAANIEECVFHSKDCWFTKTISAHILDKAKLHKELLEKAIKNYVTVRQSTKITSFKFGNDGTLSSVIDENGNIFKGTIFVDASGVSGVLSRKVGLQETKLKIAVGLECNAKYLGLENQIHLFIGSGFKGGYGWIFPVGNGRAIIGYGTFHRESIARLKEKFNLDLSKQPISDLISLDNNKNFGGTVPITAVKTKFVYKNIICVGDSVSQVNPLVGEGYRFILQSSSIAASHIQKAIQQKNTELLKGYEKEWREKFYDSYSKAKKLQFLMNLISKNDFLSNILTRLIGTLADKKFEQLLAANL